MTNRPLLARVCALDNLRAAWERVCGKRAQGGLDGQSVQAFADDAERQLDELRAELLSERYVPHPAHEIIIPKGSKPGARRVLGLPAVRDKIAQEAVRRVLEPRLDRLFLDCSYGYRTGRGPQRAVKRVSHHLISGKCAWVVTADIDDFFGSLDHDLLVAGLRTQLGDEAVLRLLELWLKMGTVNGRGRWRDIRTGVQQGCVTSPLLANFYLHPFDQSMTSQGFNLVRYADDFVVCCRERDEAERALARATGFLESRLKLHLNPNPRPIVSAADGFTFLGIWFAGGQRTVCATKCDSARARLKALVHSSLGAQEALRRMNEAAAGWRRYYGRVVGDRDLAPLEGPLLDAVVALLGRERSHGRLRTLGEARDLVAHLELLCWRDQHGRKQLCDELIDRAFRRAATGPATRPQPRGGPPAEPTRLARQPARHGDAERAAQERRPAASRRPRGRSAAAVWQGPTTATLPRGAHTHAGPGADAEASRRRLRSVEAMVRERKRRHLRLMGNVSELVVATPGSFVGKASQRLVVRCERRVVCEAPVDRLTSVTIATSGAAISSDAVALCAAQRVPVLLVSPRGETVAMLSEPAWSDGETALAQLNALAAGTPAFELATRFVRGKIRAQMNMIKYLGKHRRRTNGQFDAVCREALDGIGRVLAELRRLLPVGDYEASRGHLFSIEGRAAGHYWRVVREVLAPRVAFAGRERQGATDLVNSMLNYGYAVLQARVYQAVVRAGLNPHVSFLHALQPGKPTLVFDLMEEFRPQAVDRVVIALVGRRQPVAVGGNGMLTDSSRRVLLEALHRRLASLIFHRGHERTLQEVIDEQARAVAKHLRHEGRYRPFSCKW